ncbi:MAG TPA: pyridoxal-dependent decarboxylase [Thermoanaerobaculia bacterium]|jgi:histidine decarboxylase|nr:pyridoxal-dependent decarboxylase [Thermoanaerobaculia bacterium]
MSNALLDDQVPEALPEQDPCSVYPPVPGIDCGRFQLPPEGLAPERLQQALRQLRLYQAEKKRNFLGFQANQKLDLQVLAEYLDYHINNIGDPFQQGSFGTNSKWMERAVLDYYAHLWNVPWPHDPKNNPDSYWGYVLAMGSTEGNLYGLWNARDYLSGKFLLHDPRKLARLFAARQANESFDLPSELLYVQAPLPAGEPEEYFVPVAFYSDSTHYSIVKILRVLGIQSVKVESTGGSFGPGTIDVKDLVEKVEPYAKKKHPILLCFNYGTTFKGAYDDVKAAGEALMPVFKTYGQDRRIITNPGYKPVERTGYWSHVDGALGAAYMPFLEKAGVKIPQFDFRLPFVHSISMSGHKWVGAPWPCGIYMTRSKYQLSPTSDPAYIGSSDSTFAGSRNGFSAMILWYYLATNSYQAQTEKAVALLRLAEQTEKDLWKLQKEHWPHLDLQIARSPLSLTVLFRKANPRIIAKYSLSNDEIGEGAEKRYYSHIYMMDHARDGRVQRLIEDLKARDAFDREPAPSRLAAVAEQVLAPELLASDESLVAALSGLEPLAEVPLSGRGFQ